MERKSVKRILPEELAKIKKVLIIQYKPFGDVLLNTSYLPALRKRLPSAQIDYLVQKPFKTILEDNPNLDNLILMEKRKRASFSYYLERLKMIILVRKTHYDMILDTMRGPGTSQITLFSGAKYRIGWLRKGFKGWVARYNWVYNYRIIRDQKIYAARAKFAILTPLGVKETTDNVFYHVKPESFFYIDNWLKEIKLAQERFVVFSPVTPVPRKQWEFERFARLADLIIEKTGMKIIIMWGPGEKERVEYLVSKMTHKPIVAIATTFNQAGALLKRAYMYIGNDGGINHLAVSLDVPTLTVFGPKTDPLKWTAWHLPIHKYLKDFDFTSKTDNSFNISPEIAFDKFNELTKIIESTKDIA